MPFEPARVTYIRSLMSADPYSSTDPYGPAGPYGSTARSATVTAADLDAMGAITDAGDASSPVSGGPGGTWGPAGSTLQNATGSIYGLGKDDFLKLFLAQLQNQDPTKPVDDSQFLGQLANLTMIETLQEVQKSLSGSQLATASGLIGKHVTGLDVDGNSLSGVVEAVVQSNDAGLVLKVGEQYIKPDNVVTVDQAGK